MKTTKLLLGVAAIAAALMSARANAQNLTAQLIDVNPQRVVSVTFDGNPAHALDQNAGQLNFNFGGAFCVEPLAGLNYGETIVYTVQDFSTLAHHDTIARLVGGYLASDRTNLDAAAVQAAIWEVVLSDNGSLTNGSGNVFLLNSPDVASAANYYLANVNSFQSANLTYLTNGTRQDVVTWSQIPEPGSLLLVSLSSLVLLRRKR